MKQLAPILAGLALLLVAGIVYAAPVSTLLRNTLPETDNTYDNGTSTARWKRIFGVFASSTVSSADTVCVGTDCRTTWPSLAGGFDFTPQADGNATSTNIIFKGGFLSTASSTINANATTTGMFGLGSLFINSERFTNLLGSGLLNTGGALTLDRTGAWTGTFDGQEGTYYLDRANHTGTQVFSTITGTANTVPYFNAGGAGVSVATSSLNLGVSGGGTGSTTLSLLDILLGNGTNGVLSTTTLATNKGGTGQNTTSWTGLALTTAGAWSQYAGTSCTNQFVRSLNASGAATCATVGASDVSLANLTATDTTLTFSGTYNGSTARTIGLNLANANTWTALQQFSGNASSTAFSALNAVFGNVASSTFLADGRIGLGTPSPSATQGITVATTTIFSATQFAGSYASSTAATRYSINWDTGNTQRVMLTGNSFIDVNATSSNPRDGGKYILKVCNTGPFTGTFINIGQLNWTSGTTTISTTASTTMIGMIYDGRVSRYDIIASTTVATAQSCKV